MGPRIAFLRLLLSTTVVLVSLTALERGGNGGILVAAIRPPAVAQGVLWDIQGNAVATAVEVTGIWDKVKDGTSKVGKTVGEGVKDGTSKVGDKVKDGASKIGDTVKDGASKIGDVFKPAEEDFWQVAHDKLSSVQSYASEQLEKLQSMGGDVTEKAETLRQSAHELVETAWKVRRDLETIIREKGLLIDIHSISEYLKEELENVGEELKQNFPPPSEASGHEQRDRDFRTHMDKLETAFVKAFVRAGVAEDEATRIFDRMKEALLTVLITTGDLIEQHPVIAEALLFTVIGLVIPETFLMKPFFTWFGFGCDGPVKGFIASWAQRTFFGRYIPRGSWFSRLQRIGMSPGAGGILGGLFGAVLGVFGPFSLSGSCMR